MTTEFHPTPRVPADNETIAARLFWARARYDFAVDGGAVGSINLFPNAAIPNGSLVLGVHINVLTALASATGTAALTLETAGDVQTAVAASAEPWTTTGWKVADTVTLGAAPLQLTADRNMVLEIATAALTAGVFEVLIAYLPPGL